MERILSETARGFALLDAFKRCNSLNNACALVAHTDRHSLPFDQMTEDDMGMLRNARRISAARETKTEAKAIFAGYRAAQAYFDGSSLG